MSVRGQQKVHTNLGGLLSLIILFITFLFGTLKFGHLVSHHNPIINQFKKENAIDSDFKYNLGTNQFQLAFAFEDFLTGIPKNDPYYVKFFATVWTANDGERSFQEIPLKDCT